MIKRLLPIVLVLGACTAVQQTADQAGRDAAKSIMPQTLAIYFPEVPKDLYPAFTNCVVDNGTAADIQELASDSVFGIQPRTGERVKAILMYPETQDCLRRTAPAASLPPIE